MKGKAAQPPDVNRPMPDEAGTLMTAELLLPVKLAAGGGHWGETVVAGVPDFVLEGEPEGDLLLDGEPEEDARDPVDTEADGVTVTVAEADGVTEGEGSGPACA